MKGMMGVWIALLLGVVGAFCNWFYIAEQARQFEKTEFIQISSNRPLNPGDKFSESDFVPLPVPTFAKGTLEKSAVLYSDRKTAVGLVAPHGFLEGDILMQKDLEQPPPSDVKAKLGPDEVLMIVPIDSRVMVPRLIQADDYVSFVIPNLPPTPTPADVPNAPKPLTNIPSGGVSRRIGPYRVVSMGDRLGTSEKARVVGTGTTQENLMGIAIKIQADGSLDKPGQELSEVFRLTNFNQVQVLLHPAPPKKR